MKIGSFHFAMIATVLSAGSAAVAQPFAVDWHTIDGGGGTSAGGSFSVSGSIGQPDAGLLGAGPFICLGGFWGVAAGGGCYANCDGSTTAPALNISDFACFLNRYAAADPYANCDGSTTAPVLNINDFSCFLNRFAAGCP